jgi:hypothetical protein
VRRRAGLIAALAALLLVALAGRSRAAPAGGLPHLGYGANVAAWDIPLLQSIGFNWMKVFNPPGARLPVNILARVEASAADLDRPNAYAHDVGQLAAGHGPYVEAYEIGNEVNLDASYGWAAPPDAAGYVSLLCRAYTAIKAADPQAIVVSAGLAPTGRVNGIWNGHPGHNGLYQDEREYLKEMLDAGAGDCLDAVGYHPYGFSASYDAPPDVYSNNPDLNCVNGFCFRGTEKIYEIMAGRGLGHKQVWATEFGWIVEPPGHCLDDPGWQGRQWQIVGEAEQAANLAGAYQYAEANWPWLGGLFLFNLNFNTADYYPECEQMRFYGIEDRPAEAALKAIPKNPAPLAGILESDPPAVLLVVGHAEQPRTQLFSIRLANTGWNTITYNVSAGGGAAVVPTIPNPSGQLGTGQEKTVQVVVNSGTRPVGVYSGSLVIEATPGTLNAPVTIPIELRVAPAVHRLFLPIGRR